MNEDQLSKSANKRAAQKIAALARKLVEMPAERRDRLVVDDDVSEALQLAARLKRGARRRQTLHVANLLRDRPALATAIEASFNASDLSRKREAAQFRKTETTRDSLLRGDKTALQLVESHASPEQLAEIKSLCAQHGAAVSDRDRRTIFRLLFRITHSVLSV